MFNLGAIGSLGEGFMERMSQNDIDAINKLKLQRERAEWGSDALINNLTSGDLQGLSGMSSFPQPPPPGQPSTPAPQQVASAAPGGGGGGNLTGPGTLSYERPQPTNPDPRIRGLQMIAAGQGTPTTANVSPMAAAPQNAYEQWKAQQQQQPQQQPPQPQQAAPQAQAQPQPGQGQGGGMGGMQIAPDLGRVLALLKQRNPQASPQEVVAAATKLSKLLNPESKMQLAYMNMQMRQAQLEETRWRDRALYGTGAGGAGGVDAQVDAIGTYRSAPLTPSSRNPYAREIMNAVLQKYPDYDAKKYAGDLAGQRAAGAADPRADANALSKMVQQRAAINSFENTAIKNGRVLVQLANKVDTTGVPIIERWIRAGRKATGDTDVATFDAQMQLYRAEVAKILTNPNLTGVLTDTARKEVEAFLQGGSSAKQIKAVVELLEGDFGRRSESIDEEIQSLRGRLKSYQSGGGGQQQAPAGGGGQQVPMGGGWSVQTQ